MKSDSEELDFSIMNQLQTDNLCKPLPLPKQTTATHHDLLYFRFFCIYFCVCINGDALNF